LTSKKLFLDYFALNGEVAVNTLITLTLFLVTRMGINMEANNRAYFWSYIGFVTIFPVLMGALAGFAFETTYQTPGVATTCNINSNAGNLFFSISSFGFFGVQLIFLGLTFLRIKQILAPVQQSSRTSTNFPVSFLLFRFTASFLAQLIIVFPTQVANTWNQVTSNAIEERFHFSMHAFGGFIDALILILANPDFLAWTKKHTAAIYNRLLLQLFGSKKETAGSVVAASSPPASPQDGLIRNASSDLSIPDRVSTWRATGGGAQFALDEDNSINDAVVSSLPRGAIELEAHSNSMA